MVYFKGVCGGRGLSKGMTRKPACADTQGRVPIPRGHSFCEYRGHRAGGALCVSCGAGSVPLLNETSPAQNENKLLVRLFHLLGPNSLAGSPDPGCQGSFCGFTERRECPAGLCGAWLSSCHPRWTCCPCGSPQVCVKLGCGHEWSSKDMSWALTSWLDSPRWACLLSLSLRSQVASGHLGNF